LIAVSLVAHHIRRLLRHGVHDVDMIRHTVRHCARRRRRSDWAAEAAIGATQHGLPKLREQLAAARVGDRPINANR
jgi:hypothetical protein